MDSAIIARATLVLKRDRHVKPNARSLLARGGRIVEHALQIGLSIGIHLCHLTCGKHEQTRIVTVFHVCRPKNRLRAIDNVLSTGTAKLGTIGDRRIRDSVRACTPPASPRMVERHVMANLVRCGSAEVKWRADRVSTT
jgi:hypothetical protein